ncbi:MAG TPA: transglutaminase-like cysteine peptidase [Pseudolabrys sp.]|jgi:predicted transglutaminase-like cysteine proteinase
MRLAPIALVLVLFSFSASAESGEPFGQATVPAPENFYTATWREVQDEWTAERAMLDRCRAERAQCASQAALQLLNVIDEARGQSGRARLGFVNRAINLAIRAVDKRPNYRGPEPWKGPVATLAKGAGDCVNYAVAKYFALGEIGIPASDRRLVVVGMKRLRQQHAVVAVREGSHWLILDNRSMTIVEAADATQYFPLLVFDHRGVQRVRDTGALTLKKTLPMLVSLSETGAGTIP